VEAYGPIPWGEFLHRSRKLDLGIGERDLVQKAESGLIHVSKRSGVDVIPQSSVKQLLGEVLDGERDLFGMSDFLLWEDAFWNLVVNEGLDDSLDKYFKGSSYTSAHYVGLTDGTPSPAAGDELTGTHAGWSEVTAYDEANRQTLTLGAVSSQSVDNSASKAAFTVDTNSTTIGGAFVATDDEKGGTTSGVIYGVGAFSAGDKTLDDDDTLNVTVTLTASAS
jgi:hypothetical protein